MVQEERFPHANISSREFQSSYAYRSTTWHCWSCESIRLDLFLTWLEHFIEHVRPSTVKPALLLMDNHESHVSIAAINVAKESGVVFLTFPPHCSHKLQPLDVAVYGPLKRYFNDAANSWHLQYPGETVTIYRIAVLLGKAYPLAMTISNLMSGFRRPGILPFDQHSFGDDEFLGSFVTDRPNLRTPLDLSPPCLKCLAVHTGCINCTDSNTRATATLPKGWT